MKIAIWHNLPSGGGKRALYHHVQELLRRGHTLESWCPSTADQTYLPLNELIPEHIVPFPNKPNTTNMPFSKMFPEYRDVKNKLHAMDISCQQCAEEINQKNFDILFVSPCMFFRTTPIARYVTIPKVIYLQEPYRWLYEALPRLPWSAFPPPKRFWWSPRYLKLFFQDLFKIQGLRLQVREELLNAQSFDLILVNSLFSRESVLRAYGLEAKVCYLGIDPDLFRPTGVARENFVIGVGGVYFGKGVERAVRAISMIKEQIRPSLIWLGNFSDTLYQHDMEQLAASCGVRLTFKILPGTHDQEIVDFLNRAAVMMYTSRLEPFGLAPLEANACETPVVGIAEGGIRESIQHGINGFLVNDDDPVVLGETLSRLLENSALLNEMGKKARQHVVEKWSWKCAVDRLEQYFLTLCDA